MFHINLMRIASLLRAPLSTARVYATLHPKASAIVFAVPFASGRTRLACLGKPAGQLSCKICSRDSFSPRFRSSFLIDDMAPVRSAQRPRGQLAVLPEHGRQHRRFFGRDDALPIGQQPKIGNYPG
jgi:hypothetical protein